jgi:hypothetical protein
LLLAIILVGSCCCEGNGGHGGGDIRFSVDNQRHGLVLHLTAAMILLLLAMLLIEMGIGGQLVRADLDVLAFLRLQQAGLLLLQAIPQHENLRHFVLFTLLACSQISTLLLLLLLFVFTLFKVSGERTNASSSSFVFRSFSPPQKKDFGV